MAPKFGSYETRTPDEDLTPAYDSLVQTSSSSTQPIGETYSYKWSEVVWRNVILLSILHILALYGWVQFITIEDMKWQTAVATFLFGLFSSSLGITAGAHRLWSHRSYKAKWPLRFLLMFANTMALQNDIYEWSRDHRVHHKFSETNADPHNANRGFFFAHMGWLLLKKHKDVKEKGAVVDMSDIWSDPIVRFQHKYYIPLIIIIWGIIPTIIPMYLWNETFMYAFMGCVCFRYVYVLHCTWLVNSLAHMEGNRPYDQNIGPRENNQVIYFAFGEGYHNYHHTFPWDYSASEYGWKSNFNLTSLVIEFFEWCGLAYDLKKPSKTVIRARQKRTGDGSDNKTERINTTSDWVVGVGVTCSQLLVSLGLRFLFRTVL